MWRAEVLSLPVPFPLQYIYLDVYITNFCLLTSICSAIFALWLFSQHDEGPCFLSSKTPSSKVARRLWRAVCCLDHWWGVWVSHTMALSLLSWWPVSGQPHLFKVSQAGIKVLVEVVLCLLMSYRKFNCFKLSTNNSVSTGSRKCLIFHKRGGQR